MTMDKWLEANYNLGNERRVTLEQLVVSQEGFFDDIKNLFRKQLGKSMKGDDYKPVRLEHTYNFKATLTAISRQYGNPSWLNKQNWNTGKIEGKDLAGFIGELKPDQLINTLKEAGEFCIHVHKDWLAAHNAYLKTVQPVVKVLEGGLSDDKLKQASALLKRIPKAETHYKNPPRVFPIGDRMIPRDFKAIKPPPTVNYNFPVLNKEQTKQAVDLLQSHLTELVELRDEFTKAAFEVVGPIQTRPFIQLTHSSNPKVPANSKVSLKDWVGVASRLDPASMYWASEEFAVVRRYYGDVVLAVSRWIDRSIR